MTQSIPRVERDLKTFDYPQITEFMIEIRKIEPDTRFARRAGNKITFIYPVESENIIVAALTQMLARELFIYSISPRIEKPANPNYWAPPLSDWPK